jgi:starch-binding outer membrane protein, SusD/RagB family
MKKISIILFIALITVFTSCEDFYNVEQVGRLGEEQAFETAADLEAGVLGVYNEFDYTPAIQFNSVFTDQISIGINNGGQGITNGEFAFILNPESSFAIAWWTNMYDALNAASRVIEAAEIVEPEEGNEAQYRNALGEAYALRAWAHFELLTYFSPDLTNDDSPGVIILNFIPATEQQLPRATTGEVFTAIGADLAAADTLIVIDPADPEVSNVNPTFINKDFLTALRARISAYRGNYSQADAFATELLARYPLATPDEYKEIFLDESNAEIIFKLERTIGDDYDVQGNTGSGFAGGWAGANFSFTRVNDQPYFEMSQGLFNELAPEDVRYEVLLHESSDVDAGELRIGKYAGSEGQPLMNDLKIFRTAEMLLIKAEAAAATNDLATVVSLIDQLRDARFGEDRPAPEIGTQQTAFRIILEERRKELAYEGFRWVDIKRLGARAGIAGIARLQADCQVIGVCELPITDVKLSAVPIPLVELNANLVIEQTPGY